MLLLHVLILARLCPALGFAPLLEEREIEGEQGKRSCVRANVHARNDKDRICIKTGPDVLLLPALGFGSAKSTLLLGPLLKERECCCSASSASARLCQDLGFAHHVKNTRKRESNATH